MPEFSEELKEQCFEADHFICQKCGEDQQLQPAHKDHRGTGGDPSKNTLDNLITFCGKCHTEYDKGQFIIEKWNRNDKENGLVIYRNFAMREKGEDIQQRIPNKELYFYKVPTTALATKAQQKDQELKETIRHSIEVRQRIIQLAFEMRYKMVDGRPLYRGISRNDNQPGETYDNFRNYLKAEILPLWATWKSPRTPENLVSAYKALRSDSNEYIKSDEELEQIPPASYTSLASVLRNDSVKEEDKQYLVERATELPSGKFLQEKRDLVEEDQEKRSYRNCEKLKYVKSTVVVSKTNDGTEYYVGNKGFRACPKTNPESIIETLSYEQKQNLPCEECDL